MSSNAGIIRHPPLEGVDFPELSIQFKRKGSATPPTHRPQAPPESQPTEDHVQDEGLMISLAFLGER
jgi:hypothetical protein